MVPIPGSSWTEDRIGHAVPYVRSDMSRQPTVIPLRGLPMAEFRRQAPQGRATELRHFRRPPSFCTF